METMASHLLGRGGSNSFRLVILPKNDEGAAFNFHEQFMEMHSGVGSHYRSENFQSAFRLAVRRMESSLRNIATSLGDEREVADNSMKKEDGAFDCKTDVKDFCGGKTADKMLSGRNGTVVVNGNEATSARSFNLIEMSERGRGLGPGQGRGAGGSPQPALQQDAMIFALEASIDTGNIRAPSQGAEGNAGRISPHLDFPLGGGQRRVPKRLMAEWAGAAVAPETMKQLATVRTLKLSKGEERSEKEKKETTQRPSDDDEEGLGGNITPLMEDSTK